MRSYLRPPRICSRHESRWRASEVSYRLGGGYNMLDLMQRYRLMFRVFLVSLVAFIQDEQRAFDNLEQAERLHRLRVSQSVLVMSKW